MYGWINGCLEHFVLRAFGLETWLKIKEMAGCTQTEEFLNNVDYSDESTLKLVGAASLLLNQPVDALLELFGKHFLQYLAEYGYGSTLQCQGSTVREWLKNINEPHRLLKSRFPESSFPEFWTADDETDSDSLILHYLSSRGSILTPVVVGIAREAVKIYFSKDITFVMLEAETMPGSGKFHCVWKVSNVGPPDAPTSPRNSSKGSFANLLLAATCTSPEQQQLQQQLQQPHPPTDEMRSAIAAGRCPFPFHHQQSPQQSSSASHINSPRNGRNIKESLASQSLSAEKSPSKATLELHDPVPTTDAGVGMSSNAFCRIFPFHMVVDQDLKIVQVGKKLERILMEENISSTVGVPVHCLFTITLPDNHPWQWPQLLKLHDHSVELLLTLPSKRTLKFCGELDFLEDDHHGGHANATRVAFLINPDLKSTQDLIDNKLHLHDLPRYSFQRDLLVIGEHLKTELNNGLQLSHLSRRLQEEKKRAQDALQTKRIFVRYVSHEIRTPLNITVLGLKFVEDEIKSCNALPDTHVITEVLDDVKDSCAIAVDILNDLLLYEKLDEGYFNISKAVVSLSPFVDEAVRNFKMLAKSANVNFALHFPNQELADVTVDMDKAKMHQVLRNLMSNALKFTRQNGTVSMKCEVFHGVDASRDESITFAHDKQQQQQQQQSDGGGTTLQAASTDSMVDNTINTNKRMISDIAVTPDSNNSNSSPTAFITAGSTFIRLTVTDSGPGISAVDQHALFHEFSQVKADKLQNGQGSGLGLWIAASIVKMHGGRIGVMSEGEGFGSSFITDLPVAINSANLTASPSEMVVDDLPSHASRNKDSEDKVTVVEANKRRRSLSICPVDFTACFRRLKDCSVLIVDDVASNRKMVRRILRDKFAFFDEAENGQEAVDKFTQGLAQDRIFDVVMMDYMMPIMNGLDATSMIKATTAALSSNAQHVVVVGVTGNGQEDDIRAFENAGADIVLIKPLNMKKFDEFLASRNFLLD